MVAPPAEEHESKRSDLIVNEETKLVDVMGNLREQTLEKNREFKRQTDALDERRERTYERLAAEVQARDADFVKLRDQLQAALISFESEFEALADGKYERLQTHGLAPIAERCSEMDADMTRFFRVQIPQQIEEESGPVVRQMLKSREAFDIENTKLRSREAQFVARLATHKERTAKRFVEEATDRVNSFTALRESLHASLIADNREEERVQTETLQQIAGLSKRVREETSKREAEDAEILDTLQGSMANLQHQILENFGTAALGKK